MKKLLLLALSVTAAVSLTACGGSVKEIDTLMENLVSTDEVAANYTVNVTTTGSSTYYGTFNVDGNKIELVKGYAGSNNWSGIMYEVTGENSFNYFGKSSSTSETNLDVVAIAEALPTNSTYDSMDTVDGGYVTVRSYYVGLAYTSPFATLEASVVESDAKFEMASKYFSLDKESDTYYFVNPTFDKEVQKAMTPALSEMTIKFNYNDDKELTSVVVTYASREYTYTNLDTTEGSDQIIAVTLPTVTPAE